ncbi:MAG: 50S ribosomal protein L25 [Candidatus Colwellbacteria bacterium]|nr:50S ribosomal protein L25 [Candidatus Colwellbacteria bacterium]
MPNLNAEKRDMGVKLDELRSRKMVPAELYGRGFENIHLAVQAREFEKVYEEAGENTIVNIMVDGETYPVLINDINIDPLSRKALTIDFYRVRMDEKITAPIPLSFIGESPAIKEGGVLIKSMEEVEVESLPGNIPHEIEVDVSSITEIDGSLYVRDLKIPAGCEMITDPDSVIATVSAIEEEAEVSPVSVDAIVTEGEEKRAEKTKKEEEE